MNAQLQMFHAPAQRAETNDEYYTPPEYLEAVRRVFGGEIALDPASCLMANQNVRALCYYTKERNGLELSWSGSVYCNPPYSKIAGKSQSGLWFQKLLEEYDAENVTQGIFLCNVSTGSSWFRILLERSLVCFVSPRIAFLDSHNQPTSSPRYDNVFCYVGTQKNAFRREFSAFGVIMESRS